jgi:hypothetical protein
VLRQRGRLRSTRGHGPQPAEGRCHRALLLTVVDGRNGTRCVDLLPQDRGAEAGIPSRRRVRPGAEQGQESRWSTACAERP